MTSVSSNSYFLGVEFELLVVDLPEFPGFLIETTLFPFFSYYFLGTTTGSSFLLMRGRLGRLDFGILLMEGVIEAF